MKMTVTIDKGTEVLCQAWEQALGLAVLAATAALGVLDPSG